MATDTEIVAVITLLVRALERIAEGDFKHPAHAQNIAKLALNDARVLMKKKEQ